MKRNSAYLLLFLTLNVLLVISAEASSYDWRIIRPVWTQQDEDNFGDFVGRIGHAVEKRACGSVDSCMRSSANPYAYSGSSGLRFYADCADLPYLLRSYFAWKNGLPMSVESSVSPRNVAGNGGDIRYTPFGNRVTGRFDVISRGSFGSTWESVWGPLFNGAYPNAVSLINGPLLDITSSASYRMLGLEDQGLFTDYYPAKIDRLGIRPGTVIYDPNGHVTIIYKITDDGRVFYIDSHPDNSLTSGMFNQKFVRSNPSQGAGFKNFRPLALINYQVDTNNALVGGRIIGAQNNQLSGYGLEQFYGNVPDPQGTWSKGQFRWNGRYYSYYDYVRIKLASGILRIDPLKDMQENVADICSGLKDRVAAVSVAITAGIPNEDHPYRLPYNIYGTSGEWENYASPSRDARLKVSFMELLSDSKNVIEKYKAGDPSVIYNGSNLAADLLATYKAQASTCQISYVNSSGRSVLLNLEDIRKRLFDLSFDPYHCVELRWGAKTNQEFASCQDNSNKLSWYRQERWLRYQSERTYDARMDYSLDELDGPKPGAGIAQPPDVDIVGYLNSVK